MVPAAGRELQDISSMMLKATSRIKFLAASLLCSATLAHAQDDSALCGDETVSYIGHVQGFSGTVDGLEAILSGPGTLQVVQPDIGGCFAFRAIAPGDYAVKIVADGHRTPPTRSVIFPFHEVQDAEPYALEPLATNPFTYHWEEDGTTPAGAEYSSYVLEPRVVEFQGITLDVADAAAADRLRQDYNVLLVGEGWSQEHAFRLLSIIESIPQTLPLPASAWRLTREFIDGDVEMNEAVDGTREVTISTAAFVNAAPRIASVDGRRGVWQSRRLHHAAVRFVTDNGHDRQAYERIFRERYGVTTRIEDYWLLTAPTTSESHLNFQQFHADEILLLINMLEEMPTGMHKVGGLRYLVRRLNGLKHPLYPDAPAVAWPESGYVEFMESAFKDQPEDHIHRLILHEKAHFLWAHLFDDRLKEDWIELGGWYRDPLAKSGWSTTKSAEFVSAYAHAKNPNEDMAETLSYFVVNPDRLRARSMAKYEFVRDRIMQGNIYLAQIREDLTFEVYNLFPDYVYPGKVMSVDITVDGGPLDDKTITLTVELHALDAQKEGAAWVDVRIHSKNDTWFEMRLRPVDEHGERVVGQSTRLRGTHNLSKFGSGGYWLPGQFRIVDAARNERWQRSSDFGWRMYVDNFLEDITPPEYMSGTLTMDTAIWKHDARVQVLHVDWSVLEDTAIKTPWGCFASINNTVSGTDVLYGTGSLERYGNPNEAGDKCSVEFLLPDYMPSSTYSTVRITMRDVADNRGETKFTGSDELPHTIELLTTQPDTEPPMIDINRISVNATPTNSSAPNGETVVTLRFWHRDNISGLNVGQLLLRDPQGGTHSSWIVPDDGYSLYQDSDPSYWQLMEHAVILPAGSIPGIWGIAEINIMDRARNIERYNFVELVHFFDVESGS